MNLPSLLMVLLLLAAAAFATLKQWRRHKARRGRCADCSAAGCVFKNIAGNKKKMKN